MRFLITGATGFIGANLARALLSEKEEVHIFLRESSNTWRIKDIQDKLKKHLCDLSNGNQTRKIISQIKPNVILHLATYGGYPFQNDHQQMVQTNIIGTINLIHACFEEGFDCFINVGSSSEYGIKDNPMSEKDLLEPFSLYGATKASSTLYCQAFAKKNKLPIFSLRLFSVYGFFEEPTRLIPYLILSMLKDKKIEISSPYAVRDYIFIKDVISGFFRLILSRGHIPPGEIFNIGSGHESKVEEVFNILKNILEYKGTYEVKGIPRESDVVPKWTANIEKAIKTLGWRPKFNLEEGLKETVKWFQTNINRYEKEKY